MKSYRIIVAIAAIVLTAISWVSFVTGKTAKLVEYKENLSQAEQWAQEGLYDRALSAYESAIAYSPSEENWIKLLTASKLRYEENSNTYAEHVKYLEQATASCPKNADFLLELVDCYVQSNEYKNAYRALTNAVESGMKDERVLAKVTEIRYAYKIKPRAFADFLPLCANVYSVFNGSKWGVLDTNGDLTIQYYALYYGITGPNGERLITTESMGSRLYDNNNKVLAIFPFTVADAGVFAERKIAVQKEDGLYYYYDEFGQELFGGYQQAGAFQNGEAAVKKEDKWGIINAKGEYILEPIYSDIVLDNFGYFLHNDVILAAIDGQYHIYDKKWKSVGDFTADKIDRATDDGVFAFKSGALWGFVDAEGKVLIEPQYENALSFSNGLAAVAVKGAWGFINQENSIVIPCIFAGADYFNTNGSVCVRTDVPNNETDAPNWQLLILELGI